jgi:hypothetical protein
MEGAQALVRSRRPMPWWFFALIGVALVATIGSSIATGSLAALVTAPILVAVAALLSVLRVVVTRTHVHVQLGLWGPKIAVGDITKITAMEYPLSRYGGWGIRLGRDGSWAYSTPGGTGRGVRIEYRVDGREKAIFVSTDEADEIVRVVTSLQGGDATGVRVDAIATENASSDDAQQETAHEGSGASRRAR